MSDSPFSDHHFIVTGGTGGLGRAVIKLLLDRGATCTIPCLDEEEVADFPYTSHNKIKIVTDVDLTDGAQSEQFFKTASNQQPIRASLHLAGGFGMGSIEKVDTDDFLKMLHINTVTCFNSCKYAIEVFRMQKSEGRIVNVAARPAEFPRQGSNLSAYAASKTGVAALTQSLAQEVHDDDILINAVSPSIIDTPANRSAMPKADHNKWPKPEEIAETILYLASPANTLTHGAIVPVYGKS